MVCIYVFAHDNEDLHSRQLYSIYSFIYQLKIYKNDREVLNELKNCKKENANIYDFVRRNSDISDEEVDNITSLFAKRFLDQNSEEISKIMNWEDEWDIDEIDD